MSFNLSPHQKESFFPLRLSTEYEYIDQTGAAVSNYNEVWAITIINSKIIDAVSDITGALNMDGRPNSSIVIVIAYPENTVTQTWYNNMWNGAGGSSSVDNFSKDKDGSIVIFNTITSGGQRDDLLINHLVFGENNSEFFNIFGSDAKIFAGCPQYVSAEPIVVDYNHDIWPLPIIDGENGVPASFDFPNDPESTGADDLSLDLAIHSPDNAHLRNHFVLTPYTRHSADKIITNEESATATLACAVNGSWDVLAPLHFTFGGGLGVGGIRFENYNADGEEVGSSVWSATTGFGAMTPSPTLSDGNTIKVFFQHTTMDSLCWIIISDGINLTVSEPQAISPVVSKFGAVATPTAISTTASNHPLYPGKIALLLKEDYQARSDWVGKDIIITDANPAYNGTFTILAVNDTDYNETFSSIITDEAGDATEISFISTYPNHKFRIHGAIDGYHKDGFALSMP